MNTYQEYILELMEILCVFYMLFNRLQNQLKTETYNIQTKKTKTVYSENSTTYINLPQFILLPDQSFFVPSKRKLQSNLSL